MASNPTQGRVLRLYTAKPAHTGASPTVQGAIPSSEHQSPTMQAYQDKSNKSKVWPSPEDEPSNSFATSSPVASPKIRHALPSFKTLMQGPSPSTSPHMHADSQIGARDSISISPLLTTVSDPKPTTISKLPGIKDLQLYPNDETVTYHPLFPAPHHEVEAERRRRTVHQDPTKRRQRKRTPEVAPGTWPTSPEGWYGRNHLWTRKNEDAEELLDTMIPEWKKSLGSSYSAIRSTAALGNDAEENSPNSMHPPPPQSAANKRKRSLGEAKTAPKSVAKSAPKAKRQRTTKGGSAAPTTPTLQQAVARTPSGSVTPAAPRAPRQAKVAASEPNRDYLVYPDHTPNIKTLDEISTGFTLANWRSNAINLSSDPDRHMLHDKEIKLCEKLALPCARYLYFKRRFFAGFLYNLRINHVYNINAAQKYCTKDDMYGKPGLDVNKIGACLRAFQSVGWLDRVHFQQWMDCRCSRSCAGDTTDRNH